MRLSNSSWLSRCTTKVRIHTISQCLKITKNVAFEFLHFFTIFCYIKTDLSGNTVWLFLGFLINFCKRSSLRSHYEWDFFCDFQKPCVLIFISNSSKLSKFLIMMMQHLCTNSHSVTVFENHLKCRIWVSSFWHFPPILLKLTCLVTLCYRKHQIFNWPFLAFIMIFCPLKM